MASKDEIFNRLLAAIKAKQGEAVLRCPVCNRTNWNLPSSYTGLPASKRPNGMTFGGDIFPLVPLICINCGNTLLINLKILGFSEEDWEALTYPSEIAESNVEPKHA